MVLAVAVTLSGYASFDRHFPSYFSSHLGPVNAEALMLGEGGHVGDVNLGRASTIIKPVAIPISAPVSHASFGYTVHDSEDIAKVAARFHVTVSQIRWSNPDILTNADQVATGAQLVIAPVPGVVYKVKAGDTLDAISATYHVDAATIMDYNRLRDSQLATGSVLILPDAVGPDFPVIPPPLTYLQRVATGSWLGVTLMPYVLGPFNPGSFPVGWCTYYVATMRHVTWTGNAGQWYDNARAQGVPVGAAPQKGSIMVTWESWAGHVAYVSSVNADGSWTVLEMNALGFNEIDRRTIKMEQISNVLIGFVYGQ